MFPSFFMAGFEGTTGFNSSNCWIDSVSRTRHDIHIGEDYARIQELGISVARECVRWPLLDREGSISTHLMQPTLDAARRHGVTLIHDLFHFGYPQDLNPLTPEFRKRFAEYCYRIARFVSRQTEGVCYFTPINEPSYFAWAAGEKGLFAPHLTASGPDLKVALVSAAIHGIEAIWAACPVARIVNVDPYCRIVGSWKDTAAIDRCAEFNSTSVFEAWDMIAGRSLPELGGSARHLDIVGLNYYWSNQWEIDPLHENKTLHESDPRRLGLADIVRIVWNRYHAEILITETSHHDDFRTGWLMQLGSEIESLLSDHIPMRGVCWYPILEMPEWHDIDKWTRMGLWDLDHATDTLDRIPHDRAHQALRNIQTRLQKYFKKELITCT